MIQLPAEPCFIDYAADKIVVAGEVGENFFDRNSFGKATKAVGLCQKNLSHTAIGDFGNQGILSELLLLHHDARLYKIWLPKGGSVGEGGKSLVLDSAEINLGLCKDEGSRLFPSRGPTRKIEHEDALKHLFGIFEP